GRRHDGGWSWPGLSKNMQRLHFIAGILMLLIFLASGLYLHSQYLHFRIPEAYHYNEIMRFQYRANHLYLLAVSLIHILLGAYLTINIIRWHRRLQYAGSVFLLLAAVLLCAAFFLEPPKAAPQRPLSAFGMYCLLLGTLLHLRRPLQKSKTQT